METAERQQIEAEARLGMAVQLEISNAIVDMYQEDSMPVCVGDTILITAPIEFFGVDDASSQSKPQSAYQRTTVCLESEGIADIQIHVIPETFPMPHLHRCLFTILGCLYKYSKDTYTRKSEREFATRTEGEQVHFGDEIQLQHVNSGNFVTFSSVPAESGFQLTLGDRLGRATWVKIVGGAKGTKVGQQVYYHNRVVFQAKCEFVEYYMHLSGNQSGGELCFAVSSYSEPFTWTLRKYQGPVAKENSVSLMRPILFKHKDMKLRLSHGEPDTEEWKKVPKIFKFLDMTESLIDIGDVPDVEEEKGLLLSDSNDDGMCYWRLELPPKKLHPPANSARSSVSQPLSFCTQILGGTVEAKKEYLLRNVLTNQYLSDTLQLIPDGQLSKTYYDSEDYLVPDNCALVRLMTAKVETKSLVDGIDVTLNIGDGHLEAKVSEVSGKDVHKMIPSSAEASVRGETGIILSATSGEQSLYTFEIFNVKRSFCRFMEVTVEFLPLFKSFFNFLAGWGVRNGKLDYTSAIQDLKVLQSKQEIVARAIAFLKDQLTKNITKEMLEERQNFIAACHIHELLIDIARILMTRLGNSEETIAFHIALDKKKVIQNLLREETADLVEAMTTLLNCVAFENEMVCKEFSKIYKEICELLPLNQKFVANLLAEIYRLIDPPIHNYEAYFTEWIDRLETITQANVEQQTVFIRVVRHLSEEDNVVNPASQEQLVSKLLSKDGFKMIKIFFKGGEPYVYFFPKDRDVESQLLSNNPELMDIKFRVGDKYFFPLIALQGPLLKYSIYVSEAVLLLNTMCKDEQETALHCVQKELGMTSDVVLEMCSNEQMHLTVRRSFMFLAPTVTISRRCPRISQTRGQTSFPIDFHDGDIPSAGLTFSEQFTTAEPLAKWCYQCWTNQIVIMQEGSSNAELLDFLHAIIMLTMNLIDSKSVLPSFSFEISNAVEILLIGLIDHKSQYMVMDTWNVLWEKLKEDDDKLEIVYRKKRTMELTIQLIQLNMKMQRQVKVARLLDYYRNQRELKPDSTFVGEATIIDVHNIVTAIEPISDTIEGRASRLTNSKLKEVVLVEIKKPQLKDFISNCLISVLLITNEVRNLLFSLMRDIVTASMQISTQIQEMQLLDSDELKKYSEQLTSLTIRLQIRKRETILRLQFQRNDIEKAKRVRSDIKELLHIVCRRGKTSDDFKAIQNIARDFLIHNELVKLWGILQDSLAQQSNEEMAKILMRMLNNTLSCLYYMCLDNDASRIEIVKLLRPNFFNMTVRALPKLIQQLTDFEHVTQYNAGKCYQLVLEKSTFRDPWRLDGLEWIRASIRRRDQGRHSDLQTLAAMAIIAHFHAKKISLLSPSHSESMAELIFLLAESADANPPAVSQCRSLISPHLLCECLKAATRGSLVGAWMHFVETVYPDLSQEHLCICFESLLPWFARLLQSGKALASLGMNGRYEQSFQRSRPERVDSKGKDAVYEDSVLELWKMMSSGDEWTAKSGVCYYLPRILLVQSRVCKDMGADLKNMCQKMLQEFLKIHQLVFRVDKNFEQIDCNLLKAMTFACYKALALFARGELTESFFESPSVPDATVIEEVPAILPPISVPSRQVVPMDSLARTNSNSVSDFKTPWISFTQVVRDVCNDQTMSPTSVIKETILPIPLITKLTRATLTNREKVEVTKALKIMTKKVKVEFQPIVFQILGVVLETSEADPKTRKMVADVLRDAGAMQIAFANIQKKSDIATMSASIEFLTKMIKGQTVEFQDWFISQLLESEVYLPMFQLLSQELTASLDRIYSADGDYLTPSERELCSPYFSLGYTTKKLRDLNHDILTQLMTFVSLCCDNCNSNSQRFMSAQNRVTDDDPLAAERDSINVVTEIANYFVKLYQGGLGGIGETILRLNSCLETLTEFVTGPCEENQTLLGCDVQLMTSLNSLIEFSYRERDNGIWVEVLKNTLLFLHTFMEGGKNGVVADSMVRYLDISFLLSALMEIHNTKLHEGVAQILLENVIEIGEIHSERYSNQIIDVGFSIMMLLLKLQKFFPTNPDLAALDVKEAEDSLTLNPSVLSHLPKTPIKFYSSLIGYVEITRNGVVESEFFKIPYKCKFLTMDSKSQAIVQAMDLSHHQKIQNFLKLTLRYIREMEHQQNLYRLYWLKTVSKGWKLYGWVSFLCIFIINIALLIFASYEEVTYVDSTERKKAGNLFTICMGIIQLFASFISFICYLTEYLPNVSEKIDLTKEDAIEFPDYHDIWHNDSVLMKAMTNTEGKSKSCSAIRAEKLWNIFSNFNTLYAICFLIVSAVAIVVPALYAVLLLDVFKRSDELVNIVRAVTQNKKQLVLTIVMGIIVVYMFSMASIVGFQEYFAGDDNSMYCDTLWNCFFSIIHMGTRSGGGLGDQLSSVALSDDKYYPRILLDLLFFAVVVLIVQNIIFGIIVDTFGELRDNRQMLLEELNTQCYVCGVKRSILERSGLGWMHHFLSEHSLFSYMAFITYVSEKDDSECSGLEKYVKEKIKLEDASFFPTTSKFLQDRDITIGDDDKDSD